MANQANEYEPKKNQEHDDIDTGEHAANDVPMIDWKKYHEHTPKLKLNRERSKP